MSSVRVNRIIGFIMSNDMIDLDYLGWALSWASYLNQLSRYTKPFNIWPTKHKNIMNKMLNASDYWKEDSIYLSEDSATQRLVIAFGFRYFI